jgi:hypothetical protein
MTGMTAAAVRSDPSPERAGRARRLGQELGVGALVGGDEQEGGLFGRLADGEEPVVLQDHGLVRAERRRDPLALGLVEHDAVEVVVQRVAAVERAGVLGEGIE